jgi:hypothetical protein
MPHPLYPSLYQINTRVCLTEQSKALGRRATLDDMPDAELDRAADGIRLDLAPVCFPGAITSSTWPWGERGGKRWPL